MWIKYLCFDFNSSFYNIPMFRSIGVSLITQRLTGINHKLFYFYCTLVIKNTPVAPITFCLLSFPTVKNPA